MGVADVDVLVHHDHQVEIRERAEGGEDGVALQTLCCGVALRTCTTAWKRCISRVISASTTIGTGLAAPSAGLPPARICAA